MKRVGTYNGVPLYEDPNCPPGQLFFLNEKWADFKHDSSSAYGIKFSRWYRFKRWMRGLL